MLSRFLFSSSLISLPPQVSPIAFRQGQEALEIHTAKDELVNIIVVI